MNSSPSLFSSSEFTNALTARLFLFAALVLFFTVSAMAQTTNGLSDAENQGRALAQKICEQWPATNAVQNGVLIVRNTNGTTKLPIKIETIVSTTNWLNIYEYKERWFNRYEQLTNDVTLQFIVEHNGTYPNQYRDTASDGRGQTTGTFTPNVILIFKIPVAKSDFDLCDLGLEFFHWPAQKVLKKEIHRSCACTVLESTNPNPSTNSYSRVVSWVDSESLGIVEAYAYDANGKKLKNFYPKDIKKVNGQWQVQTLVMENLQTGSKSRLEFDLKK